MNAKILVLICAAYGGGCEAASAKVSIVAAENFYGDVATQIGGDRVDVASILSNPNQDPHLFEASASTARALAHAQITIANGADYDGWMSDLLRAIPSTKRIDISAADLVGKKSGDNPHLWYDPATMSAVADRLTASLSALDPDHKADYAKSDAAFEASLVPLKAKIAQMRTAYAGRSVAATEPVFGYMAEKLGLAMRDQRFQLAVMNNTEPSSSDVATFENDLNRRSIAVLIYNSQADDQAAKRLLELAKRDQVPVVGVTETEPAGKTYQTWMLDELTALERALALSKR